MNEMTANEAAKIIKEGKNFNVLDVREYHEITEGKIPGAQHIPLGELALRKDELDADQKYIVVCRSGNRSKAACGILEAAGYKVENMVGGMQAWKGELE
ncbi:MAG TPA: rhodanese-like domain-containing protein [Bacillales bacterium]|nr:rhodanese-like domain-containing protein [Bacillales bacterium]